MHDLLGLARQQAAESFRRAMRPDERRRARLSALGSTLEIRAAARSALPRVIFDFVDGGASDEVTMRRNVEAFDRVALSPHFLVDVSEVDLSTTVLGRRVDVPVLGAPTGLCGLVHVAGEAGLARAMQDAGSIYTLAGMSSYTIEEVRDAAAVVASRVVVFNRRSASSRGRGIGSVTTLRDRTELMSLQSRL